MLWLWMACTPTPVDPPESSSDDTVTQDSSGDSQQETGTDDAWIELCDPHTRAAPDCSMSTPPEGPGPYSRDDAPERVDLRVGDDGAPLIFQGRLWDADCQPLTDTRIEVWMARADGTYDVTGPDAEAFGWTRTDDQGGYCFVADRPPSYGEPGFELPAHVHVEIQSPESYFTEAFFEDEPLLQQSPRPSQQVVAVETPIEGWQRVQFEVVLPRR